MDRIDVVLQEFFAPAAPRDLSSRILGGLRARRAELEGLADRFRIEATERGVVRLRPGPGNHGGSPPAPAPARARRPEPPETTAARPTALTRGGDRAGAVAFHPPAPPRALS